MCLGKEPLLPASLLDARAPDWNRFLSLTKKHRVFPQVWHVLKNFPEQVPPGVLHELKTAGTRHQKRMRALSEELLNIHQLFDLAGIDWIALKGPVMVKQLYGDFSCRQTRDLDILVQAEDIDRAIEMFRLSGYHLLDSYFLRNPEKRGLYLKRENHVRFMHPEKRIFIELHWSVSKYFTTISTQYLFNQAVEFVFFGKTVKTFSPETYFLALATHGIYHRYEQLFWLYDIAWLLKNHGLRPELLTDRARKLRCETAVSVSIALAGEFITTELGKEKTNLPKPARERFILDQCRKALGDGTPGASVAVWTRLVRSVGHRISSFLYMLLMTNDQKSRWRVLTNLAIKPYVWKEDDRLPLNNVVYLLMTQIRWIKMLFSGAMKPGGRIRKQHR
jgi:hypothetical protein